jgi:iron-sulfur cluster assembly accessory protein
MKSHFTPERFQRKLSASKIMIITLTPPARTELAAMLERKGAAPDAGLRLAVRRGGCAGWQYEMQVAHAEPGDEILEDGGARIIVAADSIDRLRGCEIDYSDDLTDAGFKIHNPLSTRSCGCGTSFETSDEPAPSSPEDDGSNCGNS